MTEKIETERLVLIPTTEADTSFIFELLNTPKWLKYIGDRNINSLDDAKSYISNKILPQFEQSGFGTYTVIKKSDQKKIGTCGLYDREGLEGVDLGFAFLPEFEKNGYAYEASNRILEIAFDRLNFDEIKAITTKDNTSSQRLLEKLNFRHEGKIKLSEEGDEMLLFKRKK